MRVVEEAGGPGGDEAGGVGAGVGCEERDVKAERMRGGVVGHGGGGVGINLDGYSAAVVGEEMGERRILAMAGDLEAGMADMLRGHGAGIGDVKGEVFEFHGSRRSGLS